MTVTETPARDTSAPLFPGAPGTRARSRELGYAQAMKDMWGLLREMEDDHKARAVAEGDPAMAYALAYAAWLLGELGSYAYGAHTIHDTHTLGGGLDGFLQFMWRLRPAPLEAPAATAPLQPARGTAGRVATREDALKFMGSFKTSKSLLAQAQDLPAVAAVAVQCGETPQSIRGFILSLSAAVGQLEAEGMTPADCWHELGWSAELIEQVIEDRFGPREDGAE